MSASEKWKVGDGLDPSTMVGPLVSRAQLDRVTKYLEIGPSEGAELRVGGHRVAGEKGYFVEPTIFTGVKPDMRIAQEEIFGPVLSVISYTDVDDAVRIANRSDFGLGGSVWTADPERGEAVAARSQTGTIGVNSYRPDPIAPFGGVKDSGLGRELGPEGLSAYQAVQSIYL
jgi:acyl-CoA reductase-like NAD-dependent aldehyde dehydrogenase